MDYYGIIAMVIENLNIAYLVFKYPFGPHNISEELSFLWGESESKSCRMWKSK